MNKYSDVNTINILVTASPIDYVKYVASSLGWDYISSDIVNGKFIHVYGGKKIDLLQT